MPLVTSKKMLMHAQRDGYAIPHLNMSNLETVKSVLAAAEKLRSPVILATSLSAIEYAGIQTLAAIVTTLAAEATVPVVLHLDHSPSYTLARDALAAGWTSIMRDASALPFEENIAETKRVVVIAHAKGVPVEAELGRLAGKEEWVTSAKDVFTDPADAVRFVRATKCDSLAVSIGTSHGAYKFRGKAQLDFSRLRAIRDRVSVPLVLHGASSVPASLVRKAQKYGAKLADAKGVPEVQLKRAIREGICKINIDTDLRIAFDAALREFLAKKPSDFNPREILAAAMKEMQNCAEQKMQLFGSAGRA